MSEVLSIVINNNIIRMAQLKRVRGGIRIRRLIERECPEGMVDGNIIKKPDAFAGFIRLQMNNANVRVRDVIFTIPADKVMTREVTLPEMSDARIKQIINTNAGEYFPIKLEDYVISFYRVASVRTRTDDASADSRQPRRDTAFHSERHWTRDGTASQRAIFMPPEA